MGLDPYRSDANFVLFAGLENAPKIWQELLDRGVLVRDVGIAGTLRVSAGTESETTRFLAALREVIGQ
jgi:histidinol-phosphate aminotransferase